MNQISYWKWMRERHKSTIHDSMKTIQRSASNTIVLIKNIPKVMFFFLRAMWEIKAMGLMQFGLISGSLVFMFTIIGKISLIYMAYVPVAYLITTYGIFEMCRQSL